MKPTTLDIVKDNYLFWNECSKAPILAWTSRFKPYGVPTIEIPTFHYENMLALSKDLKVKDYQYPRIQGIKEVVKAIEKHLFKTINPNREMLNPEKEMFLGNGANNCVELITQTFIDFKNNEEILIFDPYYPMHHAIPAAYSYENVVHIHPTLDSEGALANNFELLKTKLSKKSRILIITNPNNPTCKLFSKKEYEELSDIIKDYPNLLVIEDLSYYAYINKGSRDKYISFANIHENHKRTFQVISFGKIFNTTGLRFGVVFGPSNLIEKVNQLNTYLYNVPSIIDQFLVARNLISASKPYLNHENFWEYVHWDIENRKNFVERTLEGFDVDVVPNDGTYYVLLNVSKLRGRIPEKYFYEERKYGDKKYFHPELDQAFSRMLFERSFGTLPISKLIVDNKENIDIFVRLSVNRNDDDLDFFKRVVGEVKLEII